MSDSNKAASSIYILGIALILAILAGTAASYASYKMGYKQAATEAQVELANKDKELALAKKAPSSVKDSVKSKKRSDAPEPLAETHYKASDLDIPGLSALPAETAAIVLEALNTTRGACEPCHMKGSSTAECLKTTKICENMPRLAKRAIRMARSGRKLDEIKEALTYEEPWVKVDITGAPVKGPSTAPVTIVEYSEFQCPFCARSQATIRELKDKYGDKIRLAFLNYPISRHSHAKQAAIAALAANKQGMFWQYHDLLFQRQKDIRKDGFFDDIAKETGLDIARWKKDQQDPAIEEQIKKDLLQSRKVGVRGTPTFFINGYRLRGAKPTAFFEQIIDLELADASAG